jgi:hypothetical protein
MTAPAILPGGDRVPRRALFVLELLDPVTGAAAGGCFDVSAKGLGAPNLTRAGQLVWIDLDPPEARTVAVTATARGSEFTHYRELLQVPARGPGMAPLRVTRTLQPTGLYVPPPGMLAAAGMLMDTAAARAPIPGAAIVLVLAAGMLGSTLRSTLAANSDERGAFVAVAAGLAGESPAPAPRPAPDGSVAGWIEVTIGGTMKQTGELILRQSQTNYLPAPLIWADLT